MDSSEHVLVSNPDKLVLLAEIPAADPRGSEPTATLRLLVELRSDHGAGLEDVDTMEDVTCRVPLRDLVRQGAADRAFGELVARLDNPMLRPDVTAATKAAAGLVRARCGDSAAVDGLSGMEFRLRVTFIDASDEPASDEDEDESGSDMEFGEFDLSGARTLHSQTFAGDDYEDDDDDEDGCGAQFSVRPYQGGFARAAGGFGGSRDRTSLLLSGFEARSDGPELTDQHELTSWDMQRVVRLALDDDGSLEDDEAYQRALAGGTPMSRASRAAMLGQALQSVRQPQSKSPSAMFPMRTGF
ncbi:hypothetical protein BRADI_1g62200v3 [Brachypodium distachyon]|uniref:Uncharacterized protein n=1 Tax=Brachypodium distachyon TaxID=15368 RepID=A0A2K2DT05_BRADI|nr:hypothetical protein BRADI_1g62200v3 [Brachypodium distachyon]